MISIVDGISFKNRTARSVDPIGSPNNAIEISVAGRNFSV